MTYHRFLTRALQAILFVLFSTWLVLFIVYPVEMYNDSPGYFTDAKNMFQQGYTSFRPVLYPLFLRIAGPLPIKISVLAYAISCFALYCLLRNAAPKDRLFSGKNTAVLTGLFMLTGIWNYCGTYLTESLLSPLELCIFILLVKIIFPLRHQHPLITVLYSLLISLLAMALKPWLMVMVLLSGFLLLVASFIFRSFHSKRRGSLILLAVCTITFAVSFNYNRSKSQEKMNMVLLMVSTGSEKLKERLADNKNLSGDSAAFIKVVISDIDVINNKYDHNPWTASEANEVKVLNVYDKKYAPSIEKAFRIMYLERPNDIVYLGLLSVERYVIQLHLGLACLNVAYGPALPVIQPFAIRIIIISLLAWIIYRITRRDRPNGKMVGLKPVQQFMESNKELSIFTGVNLVAGIIFSLMLCVAGGNELARTVLPATLMQVIAITYVLLKKQ